MAKVKVTPQRTGGDPMAIGRQGSGPVRYPESDGRPLAETEIHLRQIFDLFACLQDFFEGRPDVHVSSNLLLYYEEGEPASAVAPDIMVVFGIAPGLRRTYKLWEEGKAPEVVIEVTSAKTRLQDRGSKKETYAILGVSEYYMFDPTGDYLEPRLRAWRLHGDEYVEVISRPLVSEVLGLELRVVDGYLRLVDPGSGSLLAIPQELAGGVRREHEARLEAEAATQREVEARLEAEVATQREVEARLEAEAVARRERELRQALEAELGRLRGLDLGAGE